MSYSQYQLSGPDKTAFFIRKWIPEGTPKELILLVHGLSDHGGRFDHVGKALSSAGFVFIAPDLRGNGKSDGKRGHFSSLEQAMADISFLVDEAAKSYPGIPVILYGQSMGGNLALNFALRFPDKLHAVIASSPWLRLTNPPAKAVVGLAKILKAVLPSLQIPNGLRSKDLTHDTEIQRSYDMDPLIHWKISVNSFFIITDSGKWAIRNACNLNIPLLLMHGTADNITSFEASSEFAANAGSLCRFEPWEGLFHELHNEAEKGQVLLCVKQFLNSVLPGKY